MTPRLPQRHPGHVYHGTMKILSYCDGFYCVIVASICGFREIGVRERPAQLDGVWRDVILLERSQTVGA